MRYLHSWPIIAVVLLCSSVRANNHPELKWKSVATEHFIINYYSAVEPLVYPTWKIAEEVYNSIYKLYGYTNKSKINITLADYDDFSNGFAEWTSGNVMIWLTDSRFELRGNTTWLRNVITHELTHIFSLEAKRTLQLINITAAVSVSSPDETYAIAEPFPRITLYPTWFSEGIAQLESEAQGNDCWDTRRDMLLRSAVLNNKLLTLDEMGHFNHDRFGSEMVYNQGFSLVKYIERMIGSEKLRQLFKNGSEDRVDFSQYFVRFTGFSLLRLYDDWRDSLKQHYEDMIPGNPSDERIIVSYGKTTCLQKISPDGRYIAYFSSGVADDGRTDLYVKDLVSGNVILKEPRAHTACAFSPGSDKVYFIKSKPRNRHGSYYNDIYSSDLNTGKVKRITRDARVYDLAPSPDGNTIYCVRYRNNAFNIEKFNLRSMKFQRVIDGVPGESFYNVCVNNSDTNEIVVTKLVDGKSRLFVYNGIELLPIGPAAGQEESPWIAADGRIYYSADYDGIFNIYSINSNGADLRRHTNTVGGYFSPVVMNDGTIVVSKFWSGKFSVAQLNPVSLPYKVQEEASCTFKPLPVPKGKVVIKSHPYNGRLLRAVWEMAIIGEYITNRSLLSKQYTPNIDTSALEIGAYLQSYRSDALHKRHVGLSLGVGVVSEKSKNGISNGFTTTGINTFDVDRMSEKRKRHEVISSLSHNERFPLVFQYLNTLQSNEQSGDTNTSPLSFPFASCGINFGGEIGKADISGGVQGFFPMLFLPGRIDALVSIGRSFTDELSSSAGAMLSWFPLFEQIQLIMPFRLSWRAIGYVNEDFAYNSGDYFSVSASFAPAIIPYTETYRYPDTTIENRYHVQGNTSGISIFYSLPLFKYGALQVMLNEWFLNFNKRMTLKNEESSFSPDYDFVQSMNSATLVFPIVRTVNRTFIYYWDALYGSVGYSMDLFMSHSFFRSDKFGAWALFHDGYTSDIQASHTITASLKFGHTKEYLFDRMLVVDFLYEILRQKTSFSVTLGF